MIKEATLKKYADEVFYRPHIQNYLKASVSRFPYKDIKDWSPEIMISDTCGVNTAGQIWLNSTYPDELPVLEMSKWILASDKEAKRGVRHEIAHIIQFLCDYDPTKRWHGKDFTKALKIVSPNNYKRGKDSDRGWHETPEILQARKIYHPLTKVS